MKGRIFMVLKKRQIVTGALLLALGSAVFINWHYSKPQVKDTSAQTNVNLGDAQFVNATASSSGNKSQSSKGEDYFASTRMKRKAAHDEAAEMLNKVISDKNADDKSKKQAADNLSALSNAVKLEADTEALIKSKIKGECAVLINNAEVQVVVEKGVLNDNVILKIQEIVIEQTGISSQNITIIELNS